MEATLQTLIEAAEQEWADHWRRGPSRLRWDELPPQRGDTAPDMHLSDLNGQPTKLGELWNELPLLLIFWRHFGCGCAEGRLQRLRNEYPELMATGARIAVVGQAEPARASWYADTKSLPVQLLCDPEERCYRAYGLLECSPWLLRGDAGPDAAEQLSLIQKHRDMGRPVADNPFLLPGEFVIDRGGAIRLAYRYQYCDNYPDLDTLIDSIRESLAET